MDKTTPHGSTDFSVATTDQVHIRLRGLGHRLVAHAKARQTTVASVIRAAIVQLLDAHACDAESDLSVAIPPDRKKVRVLLSLTPARAGVLAGRAAACGMSRGQYVNALVEGAAPPERALDHSAMITAMYRSTDNLAAMSTDLHAFMRSMPKSGEPQVGLLREELQVLCEQVHDHLFTASSLLAALDDSRRTS